MIQRIDAVPMIASSTQPSFISRLRSALALLRGAFVYKQKERALNVSLKQAEARLKSALAAGSIGTWTWDLSSEFVAGDEFTAAMFSLDPIAAQKGIPAEVWIGRIHEDDRAPVRVALDAAIGSCGHYDIQYRVTPDGGTFRWLQAKGRVEPDSTGKGRYFHGAVMDITNHKLAELRVSAAKQQLEQTLNELQTRNEELELMTQQLWQASKLATMGELAASIAHELNNPLATMALRTELLSQQLKKDDVKQHSVTIISAEIDRMAELVGNLLQFSRRSHSQLSSLDLRKELENTVDLIQYHLRSKGIEIVKDFAEELPLVQGDRQQLRQVFLNLLTNAADAMPHGGLLTVHAHSEHDNEETRVIVKVSDTGNGISPHNFKKMWEPFFTTKAEGKGTGLGLAICRRTVEEHRGTIEVKSEPDRGTCFSIILPTNSPVYLQP